MNLKISCYLIYHFCFIFCYISKQVIYFKIDPFTGKNIAESIINKDVADHIKSCFRHSYNYFLSGREIVSSPDDDENQSMFSQTYSSFLKCGNNYICLCKMFENHNMQFDVTFRWNKLGLYFKPIYSCVVSKWFLTVL